ncbi:hypothetical protein FGIG_03616 [Fasciola gigantica]|uniref:LIM zinc-binding domain-containing protein n=1 Tax=Fasciola gigantica TaxID=46835 RepID=A0A504YAZ4_FASGI|nr:hypothetical protein FGIG_03616 [Fasciola gigantica]
MFGSSGFLTQNSVTESGQNNAVGASDKKANGQSRLPLSSTAPMNPEEREQLLRTPQSWEGISSDSSLTSWREPRSFSRHSSIRAVPQSPKSNATDQQYNRPTILSRLISHNPKSPDALCAVCSQRITAEDRYELIDQIMHRYCFKCALCGTDAGAKSQEPVKGKEENGPNVSEKRPPNVGAQRMGNLREKFEKGQMTEKKKKKTAPKIKYAGADAVKNKFIETATKASNGSANGPKGPKEFTPPPEGVTVGVLESKPKPRAPDVVTAEDSLEPVDLTVIGETTKNLRAKFKHLEETGGQDDEEEKSHQNALIDEFKTVGTEALRSARGRWKDIESGKVDALETSERPKIDIRGEVR